MNILTFSKEVHQNAVKHGFWETDRHIDESISLIHSEYSEALEEYRARRPMVYVIVDEVRGGMNSYMEKVIYSKEDKGDVYDEEIRKCGKPEGIAIELIDGVIRILDLFGKNDYQPSFDTFEELMNAVHRGYNTISRDTQLTTIIATCHSLTATAGDGYLQAIQFGKGKDLCLALCPLETVIGIIMFWVKEHGIDPEAIMLQKHNYNKKRPYKHGKAI